MYIDKVLDEMDNYDEDEQEVAIGKRMTTGPDYNQADDIIEYKK